MPTGLQNSFATWMMANPQLSRLIAQGLIPPQLAFQMFMAQSGTPGFPGPGAPANVPMPGMTPSGMAPGSAANLPWSWMSTAVPGSPQSMPFIPAAQATGLFGTATGTRPTGALQNVPGAFSLLGATPAPPLPGGAPGGGTFSVLPYPQVAPITGTGQPTSSPLAPAGSLIAGMSPQTQQMLQQIMQQQSGGGGGGGGGDRGAPQMGGGIGGRLGGGTLGQTPAGLGPQGAFGGPGPSGGAGPMSIGAGGIERGLGEAPGLGGTDTRGMDVGEGQGATGADRGF